MIFFLVTHSTGIKGPGDFLEDYLLKRGDTVLKLSHPLDVYVGKSSVFTENKNVKTIYKRGNSGLLNYFFDFYYSLKHIKLKNFDIFVGANNFDTLVGIVARWILQKRIKKIVFFASDYSENRFQSTFLNRIYVLVEKIVIRNSDFVISNTFRAEKKRIEHGLSKDKSILIPNGVYLEKVQFFLKKINKSSFIYVGNVTKEHGLLDLIKHLLPIIKRLVVIGQGNQWGELQEFVKKHKIKSELFYQKDHNFVISTLQKFRGFGLAPYNLSSKWTYYSSPLKVNEYIASGVPVIMSSVPEISEEIKKEELGIVYKDLENSQLEEAVRQFNTDNFSKRAQKFYEKYNHENLYKKMPF